MKIQEKIDRLVKEMASTKQKTIVVKLNIKGQPDPTEARKPRKKRKAPSAETRAKISAALKGKTASKETTQKMRETKKSRREEKHQTLTCPHCGKIAHWPAKYLFSQAKEFAYAYHFDNCPLR